VAERWVVVFLCGGIANDKKKIRVSTTVGLLYIRQYIDSVYLPTKPPMFSITLFTCVAWKLLCIADPDEASLCLMTIHFVRFLDYLFLCTCLGLLIFAFRSVPRSKMAVFS